jgi:hypothetical protein
MYLRKLPVRREWIRQVTRQILPCLCQRRHPPKNILVIFEPAHLHVAIFVGLEPAFDLRDPSVEEIWHRKKIVVSKYTTKGNEGRLSIPCCLLI